MRTANLIFYEAGLGSFHELSAQSVAKARSSQLAPSKVELGQNRVSALLAVSPDYRKTLALAVQHEESNGMGSLGWQWQDVQTHPTRLMKLVIEGIAQVNMKNRSASRYVLCDRKMVKEALASQNPSTS